MSSLRESEAAYHAAIDNLNAALRREPLWRRFIFACAFSWPFLFVMLADPDYIYRMPIWYQETLIQVGDSLLAIWRRVSP